MEAVLSDRHANTKTLSENKHLNKDKASVTKNAHSDCAQRTYAANVDDIHIYYILDTSNSILCKQIIHQHMHEQIIPVAHMKFIRLAPNSQPNSRC